jgi:hypothetical protein
MHGNRSEVIIYACNTFWIIKIKPVVYTQHHNYSIKKTGKCYCFGGICRIITDSNIINFSFLFMQNTMTNIKDWFDHSYELQMYN